MGDLLAKARFARTGRPHRDQSARKFGLLERKPENQTLTLDIRYILARDAERSKVPGQGLPLDMSQSIIVVYLQNVEPDSKYVTGVVRIWILKRQWWFWRNDSTLKSSQN